MTSFPKPNWCQQPPSSIQRLEAANIAYGTEPYLFPKLYAAIGTLGGKARYLISFLQEATTVNSTSIFGIIWQNKLDSRNPCRTAVTDYAVAVSGACYSRYRATKVM